MSKAVYSIEIRVIGQMRNGNHAIIDWIRGLYPGRSICFLNNVRHGDYDPFDTYVDDSVDVKVLRDEENDILVYSYEDRSSLKEDNIDFISSVFNESFERNREEYFGKSERRFDVFIIRDPFNSLASRLTLLRKRGGLGGLENMFLIKENWKILAKKIIQIQKDENAGEVAILYNKWICDKSYQEDLSKRLMGQVYEKSLDDISHHGWGSSFDQTNKDRLTFGDLFSRWDKVLSIKRWLRIREYLRRFRKNRPDMFLTRWEELSEDEEFRELMADREILELSTAIFGEIRGTREFVEKVCSVELP